MADLEVKERSKEVDKNMIICYSDEDCEYQVVEDLDMLLAEQGIYQLPLYDADT
jgi:hypothetical protein